VTSELGEVSPGWGVIRSGLGRSEPRSFGTQRHLRYQSIFSVSGWWVRIVAVGVPSHAWVYWDLSLLRSL